MFPIDGLSIFLICTNHVTNTCDKLFASKNHKADLVSAHHAHHDKHIASVYQPVRVEEAIDASLGQQVDWSLVSKG